MNDCVVGLFDSFYAFGLFSGPLVSNYIYLATSFRFEVYVETILVGVFLILYFAIVFLPLKWKTKKRKGVTKQI